MLSNKYVAALVGALLIVVAAFNIKFFSSEKSGDKKMTDAAIQKPLTAKTYEASEIILRPLVEGDGKQSWKRDPFEIPAVKAPETDYAGGMRLNGVLKRDGRSSALINGKVYGENDRVGGSVIREIRRRSVLLARDGGSEELFLDDYTELKEREK